MFTTINQSPTAEFANGGLSCGAFTAVTLTDGGVKTATAGDLPLGIVLNDDISAESVTVQLEGGGFWTAGESIAAGDFLSAGLSGVAVKSSSGNFIFAQALEKANPGAAAKVHIVRAGKL